MILTPSPYINNVCIYISIECVWCVFVIKRILLFQSYGFIDESESDSFSTDVSNVTLLLIGRESGLLLLSRIATAMSAFKGADSSPVDTTELLLDLPASLEN